MSNGAWAFLLLSWGFIFGLNIYCLTQFMRKRK